MNAVAEVKNALMRPVFKLDGLTITVGVLIVALIAFWYWRKHKG